MKNCTPLQQPPELKREGGRRIGIITGIFSSRSIHRPAVTIFLFFRVFSFLSGYKKLYKINKVRIEKIIFFF